MEVATNATISCNVTGITRLLDDIKWMKGAIAINNTVSNYQVNDGTYDLSTFSQTTTLTVLGPANDVDTMYKCLITSNEWGITDRETDVSLNVFCKFHLNDMELRIHSIAKYVNEYIIKKRFG